MSDVLRPEAASALEAWRRRVSANREQAERLREGTPPRDFYAAVASDFRASPRRTDEPALDHLRSLSQGQIDAMADPKRAPYSGLPTIEEAAASGAYLCGPPAQIIDTLMRLEKDFPGLERVSVSHPIGAPASMMLEQLEWFAAEVMPAFTRRSL